jgi:hypothetical protein
MRVEQIAQRQAALVQRQAPWPEMLDLVAAAAPHGFLIYFENDVDPVVRLAGDRASGVAYLMGNHTRGVSVTRSWPPCWDTWSSACPGRCSPAETAARPRLRPAQPAQARPDDSSRSSRPRCTAEDRSVAPSLA